jgi:endonuclease YncB( thermonuclease family)
MPESNQTSFVRKYRSYLSLIVVSVFVLWKFGGRFKASYFPEATTTVSSSSQIRHIGNYEVLDNCQWIEDKGNDGDSFKVKHGGKEYTIRLYFVDAPEKYLSDQHADQRKRVAQQGEYFGGLSVDQTVEIGLKAKAFTEKEFKGKSFTILTKWESVYESERFYAVVWLPGSTEKKPKRLSDALIMAGLVRIHTKGPDRQNASGFNQFQDPGQQRQRTKGFMQRLKKLEYQAKESGAGAWGVK